MYVQGELQFLHSSRQPTKVNHELLILLPRKEGLCIEQQQPEQVKVTIMHENTLCGKLRATGVIDGDAVVQTPNESEADLIITEVIPRGRITQTTILLCHEGRSNTLRNTIKGIPGADKVVIHTPVSAAKYIRLLLSK